MSAGRPVRWIVVGCLFLGSGLFYLGFQVKAASERRDEGGVASPGARDREAPRPAVVTVERAAAVDLDGLADRVAERVGNQAAPAQEVAAEPLRDRISEAALETARTLIEPYAARRNMSISDWNELIGRLTSIPDADKRAVYTAIFGAINRREIVPPDRPDAMEHLLMGTPLGS
jgi:hypothetical protein